MNAPTDPRRRAKTHGVEGPRRFVEQRWLLDNIIASIGIDWDQNRSNNYPAACLPEANSDFAGIKARVKKLADFTPAFEAAARRRENRAIAHETAGEPVNARQNYFIASVLWSAAQWPIDRNNELNLFLNARKRECYSSYARLSDHHVEAAWVPFQGRALPGWLHLPPGYSGGTIESKTNFFSAGLGPVLHAVSIPLHIGRTTSVWQTTIRNPDGSRVAIVTQTQIAIPKIRTFDISGKKKSAAKKPAAKKPAAKKPGKK